MYLQSLDFYDILFSKRLNMSITIYRILMYKNAYKSVKDLKKPMKEHIIL